MNNKPEDTFHNYVRAFESLDPDAIVSFYHLPCMFIAPTGASLVTDDFAANAMASMLVEHARSAGYKRTEIFNLEVRMLGVRLASLTGVFTRFNLNDEEISRFGFTYIMQSDGAGWKIVVAIAHDAPTPR